MRLAPIALTSLLMTGTAYAHIAMTFPPPRSTAQKTGPCGAAGSVRGTNVTTFSPGELVVVEWDETVDHPGHYRIAFDDDGNDFQNPNNPDDNFPGTMVEPITDKVGGHYTQEITLPNTPCESCTLQLIQVMTTSVPYNSFYFQCADIRIAGNPSDEDDGGGGGDTSGGCSTSGSGAGVGVVLLALAALLKRRK